MRAARPHVIHFLAAPSRGARPADALFGACSLRNGRLAHRKVFIRAAFSLPMTFSRARGANGGQGGYRSWGELQIARMLARHGLSFQYEQPVAIVEHGRTRLWYPDFQLRGHGILLEYCGRPHDPDYAAGIERKQAVYAANGLTALMFTPDLFQGPWPTMILDQIEDVLVSRLDRFRAARHRAYRSTEETVPHADNGLASGE